jgi:hypothetical protein
MTRVRLAREPELVRVPDFVTQAEAEALLARLAREPLTRDDTGLAGEIDALVELEDLERRVGREVGYDSHVRSVRYRCYDVGHGHPLHPDHYEIDGCTLVATAMLVLSAPDAGGATEFPHARPYPVAVELVACSLVHWRNVSAEGTPLTRSAHRGVPVREGRKCVLLFFVYVPLEAYVEAEKAALAHDRAAPGSDTFAPPAPGKNLVCIVDARLPEETSRMLREACDARDVVYTEIEATTFDYSANERLAPGTMLFRPSVSRAAQHVEEHVVTSEVATFHREVEGTFFPCVSPMRAREREGIAGPRWFPVATSDFALVRSFVDRLGGYPVVVKVPGGEGGLGVMRAESEPTLRALLDHLVRGQNVVPQLLAYVPEAMHHRVIVVGDRAVGSYKNPILEGDFRSAPSSDPADYTSLVPDDLASIAVRAVRAERLGFGGVDVLVHASGRMYVLEVNYPCYFPQATLVGGIDVAGPMLDFLIARAHDLCRPRAS